jgi:hypothetical protein
MFVVVICRCVVSYSNTDLQRNTDLKHSLTDLFTCCRSIKLNFKQTALRTTYVRDIHLNMFMLHLSGGNMLYSYYFEVVFGSLTADLFFEC